MQAYSLAYWFAENAENTCKLSMQCVKGVSYSALQALHEAFRQNPQRHPAGPLVRADAGAQTLFPAPKLLLSPASVKLDSHPQLPRT